MARVSGLSPVTQLALSDLVVMYSLATGATVTTTISSLIDFIEENIDYADDFTTQYSAPSATAFSVQVTDSSTSIWLVLTPTAGFAAGTIVLPDSDNCVDKQEILVNCTQAVTTLTIDGNGSSVSGGPSTLSAGGFFKLRYDAILSTWYRVG